MKVRLVKILLVGSVLLGLMTPVIPFNQSQNQIRASEDQEIVEVIELLPEELILEEPELPAEPLLPGRIEGTGTFFEIKDSEYLNISLKSTEEIKVVLESIPRMISLDIETASNNIGSTALTIEGLEPNKTYYKYQDSYKQEAVFISSENGSHSWTQDLTQSHHIWIQEEKGTIFLPEDCSTYGIWDGATSTCILNQDLTESVEITADNITLDCNGHRITTPTDGYATGGAYGVYLNNKEGIVIRHCNIDHFTSNIYLNNSSKNTIIDNNISYTWGAIRVQNSSNNNIISNNNITSSYGSGILLWRSSINNIVSNNNLSKSNIRLSDSANNNDVSRNVLVNTGLLVQRSYYNVVENNIVNDKPLVYLENVSDYTVTEAGQVILVNSNNITVENLEISNTLFPIQLLKTNNSHIKNNNLIGGITGGGFKPHHHIYLENSSANILDGNEGYGIQLIYSSNNQIQNNNFENIELYRSSFNEVNSNFIRGHFGLVLNYSSDNLISNNIFKQSGLFNNYSTKNKVENNIVNDKPLVYLENVSDYTVTEAGQVILVNSNNIIVENLDFSTTNGAIQLLGTKNSKIRNNNISWQRGLGAIFLDYSSNNSIGKNTINMGGATIFGIRFRNSSNNNIISDNNISYVWYGIALFYSSNNKIYHNDFIRSSAYIRRGSGNLFDNGYPSGGNYWSDYIGEDLYSSPNQDQPGADGIGDTPYAFYGGQDRYPFILESGWEAPVPPNQPPICSIELRKQGTISLINEVDIGEFFDIYAGDSTDDTGIKEVRFSSDDSQDGNPTGQWTEWYNWENSLEDWNPQNKTEAWSLTTAGKKEVWAEVKDDISQTNQCSANIFAYFSFDGAVILAETSEVSHNSSSITAQPCRLLPKKTYPNGHSKEYYQDLAYCVADYHKENSFGTVNLNFTIYDNDGEWFKLDKSESYYAIYERELVKDAEALAGIDSGPPEGKKIVIIIHAGTSRQKDWWKFWKKKISTQTWGKSNKIVIAEDDPIGAWGHEIGHVLGVKLTPENTTVPDLYKMGNVGKWDIMATGSWNEEGNNPLYMNSYTKEFLRWLNYDIHPKSAYGEYWINSLETSEFRDSVFRYNLSDDSNDEFPKYYILETRNKNLKTWDSSLPEDKALVLYYVDTKGYQEYGYDQEGMIYNQYRTITIPGTDFPTFLINDGILSPNIETYQDLDNLVKFTARADRMFNDKYEIQARIEEITYDSFIDRFRGIILRPSTSFRQKVEVDSLLTPLKTSEPHKVKNISSGIQLALLNHQLDGLLRILRVPYEPSSSPGELVGQYPPKTRIGMAILRILEILIFIIIFNLLLIWLNKKIIPRWSPEKGEKITKILIKILWIAAIIAFIFLLYLLIVVSKEATAATNDLKEVSSPPLEPITLPDLDLHLYTDDGKHIGMNYQTGEYEIQIEGAIISGDNQDAPEWIFIPQNITNYHFVVSSYDNQKFLEENPEIAQEIVDVADNYDIYARYIDPTTDIYTSTIISEDIEPGAELEHPISGTSDIVIEPGVLIARVNFDPEVLNLKSEGQWITGYIELPIEYHVREIDINIVSINEINSEILATPLRAVSSQEYGFVKEPEFYDTDNDGILELMVRFNRKELLNLLNSGQYSLTITGKLKSSVEFRGIDSIKVIP